MISRKPYSGLVTSYDALLGDKFFSELRHIFEWLVRTYNLRFDSAADVACGTGTFIRHLCAMGVPYVVGVDRSWSMLRRAIKKNARNRSAFFCQDFRTLQLPYSVDLITCHFDSLNYMLSGTDLRQALSRFALNLRPGGHAIFDLITERSTAQSRGPTIEHARGRIQTITRITHRDSVRRLQVARIHIRGAGSVMRETHVQRAYSIAEVVAALDGSGLQLRAVHDFHKPSRAPCLAERALYLARRAPESAGALRTGITSPRNYLPNWVQPADLRRGGAGDGNRTRMTSLEGSVPLAS